MIVLCHSIFRAYRLVRLSFRPYILFITDIYYYDYTITTIQNLQNSIKDSSKTFNQVFNKNPGYEIGKWWAGGQAVRRAVVRVYPKTHQTEVSA